MFRSRVGGNVRSAGLAGYGSDVDDSPPAALNHFRKRRSHAEKSAAQVYGKVPEPEFIICFGQRSALGDARVVNHNVRAATKIFFDRFKKPFNAADFGYVANQRQHTR